MSGAGRRGAALLALMAAVLAGGCTGPAEPGVAVLCSNDAAVCEAWAADVAAATGLRVSMLRLPTSQALARLQQSAGSPEFDVWHGGPAEAYVQAAAEGLLEGYQPAAAAAIPAQLRGPGWTGVYASLLAFCTNADRLDRLGVPTPRTWSDLLDPRLRDEISASSPLTSGTAFTTMVLQEDRLGRAEGRAYLRALYAQVLQFTRSGTAPAHVVAGGDAAVALTFAPYCESEIDAGHALDVTLPRDGTGYEVGAVAVLAGARSPGPARAYVDRAVSAAGQAAGAASGIHQIPTHPDLPGHLGQVLVAQGPTILAAPIAERATRREALLGWFGTEIGR